MRAWFTGTGALLLAPVLAVFSLRSLLAAVGVKAPWSWGPLLGIGGALALGGLVLGVVGFREMPREHRPFLAMAVGSVLLGHFLLRGVLMAPLTYGGMAMFLAVPSGGWGRPWVVAGAVLAVGGALLRELVLPLGQVVVFAGAGVLAAVAVGTGARLLWVGAEGSV